MTPDVLTLTVATLIITVTCRAFWHNQPARPPNDQRGDLDFGLRRLVNGALEWLVFMPHLSNPAEKKEPAFLTGKVVILDRQTTFFRRVLRALCWKFWRRILVNRAVTQSSVPAH